MSLPSKSGRDRRTSRTKIGQKGCRGTTATAASSSLLGPLRSSSPTASRTRDSGAPSVRPDESLREATRWASRSATSATSTQGATRSKLPLLLRSSKKCFLGSSATSTFRSRRPGVRSLRARKGDGSRRRGALVRGDESFKYADKARFAELILKGGLAKPAAALTNSTVGRRRPISTKTTCRRCFAPGSRLRLRRTTSTKLCGEQSSYSATKRLTTRASYASIPTTRATTSGFSRTRSNTFLRGRSLSNRPGTTHPELPAEACGEDLKACSRCKSVRYCCEAHQKLAWPTHRIVCFAPQW